MMLPQLIGRTLHTASFRCMRKFAWNFGVKGLISVERFKRRLKRGEHFPPYLYLSITSACNLRCQGCWVDVDRPRTEIEIETLNRTITDAKKHGNCFFGVLGGEPFMHPGLISLLRAHSDCYFQIFTNGQFLTDKVAGELRAIGNATPLISIEGLEATSDVRRGNKEVFGRTMRGLEASLKAGLLTGVATSVCQSNFNELLRESWLDELIRRGVHYVWYHSYRPVGPKMNPELALRPEQLVAIRKFVVEMRGKKAIAIIDAYYDAEGHALCPMVTGISHHIGPGGDIEPCPIIQFAAETIRDNRGIYATMRDSAFLKDFREATARSTRGCVILERPDLVKELVLRHGAHDSTSRGTALAELEAMVPRFSQWLPGAEVPEKHWMYKLAKKYWFSDFGAYQAMPASAADKAKALQSQLSSNRTTTAKPELQPG